MNQLVDLYSGSDEVMCRRLICLETHIVYQQRFKVAADANGGENKM